MSLSKGKKVSVFAFYSRLLILLLQILFNALIPDHDADVFNPPTSHKNKALDFILDYLLSGLRKWDGVYFIHIAEYGYIYENTLAFFPLFPLLIRILANTVFYPLTYMLNYTNVLTLSACVMNIALFVEGAKVLYELSRCIIKDDNIAFKATLLFCINPASIFFTAAYSETLFAYLTFNGLLCLYKKKNCKATSWFALSCLTRSNGFINIGFIVYLSGKEVKRLAVEYFTAADKRYSVLRRSLIVIGVTFLQILTCVCSFLSYQYYAYKLYCVTSFTSNNIATHLVHYGNERGYKMYHTGPSEWCQYKIPLSYSYVQSHHWGNGFLNYYEFKQIPNFLLATPMVLICVCSIVYYVRNNFIYCLTLGLGESPKQPYKKSDDSVNTRVPGYLASDVYVYVVHLLFLVTFAVLMMHIQVTTRFIASSSPLIYWYIATITMTTNKHKQPNVTSSSGDCYTSSFHGNKEVDLDTKNDSQNEQHASRIDSTLSDFDELYDYDKSNTPHWLIFVYFHLYFFTGTAAFPNGLPWT